MLLANKLVFSTAVYHLSRYVSRVATKIRKFTTQYAGLLERWDKQIVDQASDVPSIIFFRAFLQNSLQNSFQFIFSFFFIKLQK